jgi:hypothetical protein
VNTKLNTEMNTPTPRTDELYLRHANYCDQEQADEAIEDFRDLARTLERELGELLAVNATGAARLAHTSAQLAAEREKVRALRLACERIVEQWDKNHDAAPFHAGNVMYSRASAALAATEDAQ